MEANGGVDACAGDVIVFYRGGGEREGVAEVCEGLGSKEEVWGGGVEGET